MKSKTYQVIQFPDNIASIPARNSRALNEVGVKSLTLLRKEYKSIETVDNSGAKFLSFNGLPADLAYGDWWGLFGRFFRQPFKRVYRLRMLANKLLWHYNRHKFSFLTETDLMHVHFANVCGTGGEKCFRDSRVPGVVTYHGSDIRIREVDFQTNPYVAKVLLTESGARYGNTKRAIQRQTFFAELSYRPVVSAGMMQYLIPEARKEAFQYFHALDVPKEVYPPSPDEARPLIIHAPSSPPIKGSSYVRKAVERLRRYADFEYVEVTGMDRKEVIALMKRCDIFIDQLILGDYGMACIEAMSYGKPSVCFVKPSVLDLLPGDLPIVNACPDNLTSRLLMLIRDGEMRNTLGKASRKYVEDYHDSKKVAMKLNEIYREVLEEVTDR